MRRLAALLVALLPAVAFAGHGQDFLLVNTPGGPASGELWLLTPVSVVGRHAPTRATFEPALLLGVGTRGNLQLQTHEEDDRDGGWHTTGTTLSGQYGLTSGEGTQAAVSLAHDFNRGAPDATSAQLALQGGSDRDEWGADLGVSRGGGTTDWGVAFGWRHAVRQGVAVSLEGAGSLQHADGAEVALAAHVDTQPGWALKLGIGAQRADDRVVPVARAVLFVRLRDAGH